MRLYLILPFIGFLLRKSFSGVFKLDKTYRREMEKHPGLAIFMGAVCSILFVAVVTILGVIFFGETVRVKYICFTAIATALTYVSYTFFRMLFNSFLEERQELFDIIKDERPLGKGNR